jgi:phenylpropionate dioxygenase-like ring-hydroxylating dioxygenase large terminal subunit
MATLNPWWVPVAGAADLNAATPLAAFALGEGLVLWRSDGGTSGDGAAPSVFLDRCPHRGARLSLGRIEQGALECAYHGWRFDAAGQCIAIPALPAFEPPPTHHASCRQAMERHGLVWVAAADAPRGAPYEPDALQGLPARRVLCGPFDVAASAPRVVENFLDTAHFGFVHEGSLGTREQLAVPDYRVEADPHGRPMVPLYRAWQPRASSGAAGGAWVSYSYRVLAPGSAVLTKKAEGDAPAEAYALWCCPLDEERTRVWFTICTDDAGASETELRRFQAAIFAEDAPLLESQQPKRLPLVGGELSCAADRLSAAYRRWLHAQGALFGTC